MSTVKVINVNWPQDANGKTYSIHTWIQTLTPQEQDEWHTANNQHNQMVLDAVASGDAEIGSNSIHWKNKDVWDQYQKEYLTPEIRVVEEKYWNRFYEVYGLTPSDIFGKKSPI